MHQMIAEIINGFSLMLTVGNMLAVLLGLSFGVVFGAIPGLSATMAIALVMPLTYNMDPIMAFAAFLAAYKAGMYGGSISAILINTPGVPASVVTTFDGYPMAQKGEAPRALDMALWASVLADFFSTLCLIFLAVAIAKIALKFGPPEYASLTVFALLIVSGVSGSSVLKGIITASLGFLMATVGLDPVVATERYTFGMPGLLNGIGLMVMLIGLFAISEILIQAGQRANIKVDGTMARAVKKYSQFKDVIFCLPIIVKSILMGVAIGAMPGIGGTTAAFVSYAEAKRASKHPEEFGKGSLEGVAAAEAGNNATVGGALIPLLALGIPGDVTTAVLLGALMIHGLTPGPTLFTEHSHFVYAIFAALLMSSFLLPVIGKIAIRMFGYITRVPKSVLFPILAVLCTLGVFGFSSSFDDLKIMLFFGVLGYFVRKLDFPLAPLLIGFILEPICETSIRQSLILSDGSFFIFVTRPLSAFFLLLAVAVVLFVAYMKKTQKSSVLLG
jgi:putative tricarboxylic transport membrane protein